MSDYAREVANLRRTLRKFIVGLACFAVLITVAIWAVGYSARHGLVESQRRGCERGKLDRAANASGWRAAQEARLRTAGDRTVSRPERASALEAARLYGEIVRSLEARSRIDCGVAFPDPSLFGG